MELKIYDNQGLVVMTVSPDNSSQWNHEVGVENVVTVNFTTWEFLVLQVGWYVVVDGKEFSLKAEYRPKHIHNSKYTYNLKLYGREHDMQDLLFCRLNQGDDDLESVFAYDGTPMDFLQKVVANMNRNGQGVKWKAGEAITANRKTINFNGLYCWDALNEIAQAFNTEWWMDGEYLNLTKCVHGESVELGYGQGFKTGLSQNENTGAALFFTRLIPVGSTKNIDRSKYGYTNLQLPGREKYIDINTHLGLKEYREEAAFAEIYPHREGTLSSVRSEVKINEETGEYTVYFVKDAALPFNPDDYMLGGEVVHMTFNDGNLAGKDFEVNWNNDTQEFEIITQYPDETAQLPGGNLIPSVGDKYVLSNISMPDEYNRAAEQEYKGAVDAFLAEYAKDNSIYSGQTDYIYIGKNNVPLSLGQRVTLLSAQYFEEGSRESRITRISRKLNNLNEATVDCSDAVASSWKSSVDSSINQLQFSVAQEIPQGLMDVLKTWDADEPSNYNVLSALRSLNTFLNKTRDDRSRGLIASDKGFHVGEYNGGTLGSGAAMFLDEDGNTYIESDFLSIRKKAMFTDITVQELKHVGGAIILSKAAMVCSKVEKVEDGYKCYFKTEDSDGRKLYNEFAVGDQARCQTFNLKENTYYWRLVTELGEDYIVLSEDDCDANSDIPKDGDNISLLGNRTDTKRQNAIVLSAYGDDAPSYKQYRGINSYSLEGKQVTKLSPDGNELTGIVRIEAGSTGAQNLEDFPDEVFKAVHIGAVNLLLNSGFTGDFLTEDLESSTSLHSGLEMYSKALEHWTGTATVNTDTSAVSGRTATIGSLTQAVKLIAGESYVISFRAKGTSLQVKCGNFTGSVEDLTSILTHHAFKFVSDGNGTFSISGDATICDLQLERGTIATDWMPSPQDNDKTLAEYQAIRYLRDAIKEGDTSILGGLILTNMMMLGNYKDGAMQEATAGVSGIYNDDDDVAFWGGGTLEQAIATLMKFKQNPRYKPTASEWANMANFVVDHGGNCVFRGNIFADSGYFRGLVEIADGKIVLKEDGSGLLAKGSIWWTPEGVMYRRAPENVEWVHITSYPGKLIDYTLGLYIDVHVDISDTSEYTLLTPPTNNFSIILSIQGGLARRSTSATIVCPFQMYDGSKYVTVNKIRINDNVEMAGKEVKLTYRDGYWYNDGGAVDLVDDVAVLGSNNTFSCSEIYATRGDILILDSILINNSQYYVDNVRGHSESMSILDKNGDSHVFTFKEGLLTGYTFTDNDSES